VTGRQLVRDSVILAIAPWFTSPNREWRATVTTPALPGEGGKAFVGGASILVCFILIDGDSFSAPLAVAFWQKLQRQATFVAI